MRYRGSRWMVTAVVATVIFTLEAGDAAAKTLAYLFNGEGEVLTFDTDTDTITVTRPLPNIGPFMQIAGNIVASPADNLLFIVEGARRFGVRVFEFRSLCYRGDLGLGTTHLPDVLVPPTGSHFFVKWAVPSAGGAEVVTRFDKATLKNLGNLPQVPGFLGPREDRKLAFSPDGARLYAYNGDPPLRVEAYNPQNLQVTGTYDVSPLVASGILGAGVDDIQADRALVGENSAQKYGDPPLLSFFTLNLLNQTPTPRITTGLYGQKYLTPRGDKILFNEARWGGMGGQSVGRLHVYDVATGAKLGLISFRAYADGEVAGIRPQGDKVYFWHASPIPKQVTLTSLSLTTFAVIKEVTARMVPIMIFFEQP